MQLSGVASRVVPYGLKTASLANAAQITFLVNGFAHAALEAGNHLFGNNATDIRISGDAFAASGAGATANSAGATCPPMFLAVTTATKFKNSSGGAYANLHIGGLYFT